jgi:tetratricopeptide (TPR) repeat protein
MRREKRSVPDDIHFDDDGEFSQNGDASIIHTERINELSKRGYQLLKENSGGEAAACFQKILEIDPTNNYALVGMGDCSRKHRRFHDAVDYYERCLEYYPENNYALFGLADCYKALNHFHKAILIWEKYLGQDQNNVTVLTRVADAYRKLRDFKNSKSVYEKVLSIDAYNPYAIIGLGHLHYDFKEYREALYYWERMLERRNMISVDIRVLTSIGNCHRKLKTFEDGIIYFDAAVQREPSNFYALFGLADCFRGLNQPKRSLDYWNQILELDPRNKVILTRAGDAYCTLKDYDKAIEYYRRALSIDFDTYAMLGLAIVDREQGRCDSAISSLRTLLDNEPKNHRAFKELAECYVQMNDTAGAIEVLREFQTFGIKNNHIYDMLTRLEAGLSGLKRDENERYN